MNASELTTSENRVLIFRVGSGDHVYKNRKRECLQRTVQAIKEFNPETSFPQQIWTFHPAQQAWGTAQIAETINSTRLIALTNLKLRRSVEFIKYKSESPKSPQATWPLL